MDLLIFDLDGTLIDSSEDLAQAVNATRTHLGLRPLDHDTVASYVGNGAPVLIRRALPEGTSEERLGEALAWFLAYYDEHKLDHTVAYDGVEPALARLHDAGVRMAVLTNKPVRISGRILEGLGLARYFARIYGGNSFEQKKPDPVGVQTLLREMQVAPGLAMMVGDSAIDVRTARNAGIRACGVRYGFQPESFDADPPDIMVDRLEDLAQVVIAERKTRGALQS
jgi:phosphoglycolate phosphatase